jgi:hypothetical protein
MPQRVENSDRSGESSTLPVEAAPAAASLAASGALTPHPGQDGGISLPPPSSSPHAVAGAAAAIQGVSTLPTTQQASSSLPLRLHQNNEALIPHSNDQISVMDHRIALSSSSTSSLNPATMERLGNRTSSSATMGSTMQRNLFPHSLRDEPSLAPQQPPPVASKTAAAAVKDSNGEAGNPTTTSKPKPSQEQQSPSSEEGVEQFANEIIYLFAESSSSGSDAAPTGSVSIVASSGEDGCNRGGGPESYATGQAGSATTTAAGRTGLLGTGTNTSPSTDESHYTWDNIFE